MTNTLLKFWDENPCLEIRLHNSFPLAERIPELKDAYSNRKPKWNFLRQYWSDGLYINPGTEIEWNEVILTLKNFEEGLSKSFFDGYKTDSFTIQAQRTGKCIDYQFIETVIYGMTIGKNTQGEEHIIFGKRGGSESVGQIVSVPAGAVAFPETPSSLDPIQKAVYQEGTEEAGIQPEETIFQIIGAYQQVPPIREMSNVFVVAGKLSVTINEILERHQKAMETYHQHGGQADYSKRTDHSVEATARKALAKIAEKNPKIPKDAWENENLIIVRNQPDVLTEEINKYEKILHGLNGAIALYFLYQFGEAAYRNLMDNCPSVKAMVNEKFLL